MITNVTQEGIDLIKKFEGCSLKAYKCPAGVLTIGYGHTKNVKKGDVITQKEAEALLYEDLDKYVDHVRKMDEKYHYNFNQNEFNALVSFAFNVGSINSLTNNGKRTKFQISCKIKSYVYAGGHKLLGLVNRRNAEYELYMKPVTQSTIKASTTYKVNVSGLNVRVEATVNSSKIKTLRKGVKVTALDVRPDTEGNIWIKTKDGYVAAIYQGKQYLIKEV